MLLKPRLFSCPESSTLILYNYSLNWVLWQTRKSRGQTKKKCFMDKKCGIYAGLHVFVNQRFLCLYFNTACGMARGILMWVCWLLHHCGPNWNISTITGWNVLKRAGTDSNDAPSTNPTEFDDPLTLSTNSRARFSLILWNISTSTSLIGTKWGTEMDRRCGGSLCDVTHCRLRFCSPEINILSVTILVLWSQSDYIGWESGAGRQPGVD